jgi:hypothetical protein
LNNNIKYLSNSTYENCNRVCLFCFVLFVCLVVFFLNIDRPYTSFWSTCVVRPKSCTYMKLMVMHALDCCSAVNILYYRYFEQPGAWILKCLPITLFHVFKIKHEFHIYIFFHFYLLVIHLFIHLFIYFVRVCYIFDWVKGTLHLYRNITQPSLQTSSCCELCMTSCLKKLLVLSKQKIDKDFA